MKMRDFIVIFSAFRVFVARLITMFALELFISTLLEFRLDFDELSLFNNSKDLITSYYQLRIGKRVRLKASKSF
jgi:hypothetical protein